MNVNNTSSKIVEPDTYKKAIRDLIYVAYQKKNICIKLENLNNTWKLSNLLTKRNAIENKWVFKVKYNKYK